MKIHNQDAQDCEKCLVIGDNEVNDIIKCTKNRYRVTRVLPSNNLGFVFCIDSNRSKEARFIASIVIDGYLKARELIRHKNDSYERATDVAVHNTRNLVAQITSKLNSLFDDWAISQSAQKILYIEQTIKQHTFDVAKELLSIMKLATQISVQYSIIDYLRPDASLKQNEFAYHEIHRLMMIFYYLFEQEFSTRNINVEIQQTREKVFVNYNTIMTAIVQLFHNCLKYCADDSTIIVKFINTDRNYLEILFEMLSVYLTEYDIQNILRPGVRGQHVSSDVFSGLGLGMGIIHRMIELNKGYLKFGRLSDEKVFINSTPYSHNYFSINLCKRSINGS